MKLEEEIAEMHEERKTYTMRMIKKDIDEVQKIAELINQDRQKLINLAIKRFLNDYHKGK